MLCPLGKKALRRALALLANSRTGSLSARRASSLDAYQSGRHPDNDSCCCGLGPAPERRGRHGLRAEWHVQARPVDPGASRQRRRAPVPRAGGSLRQGRRRRRPRAAPHRHRRARLPAAEEPGRMGARAVAADAAAVAARHPVVAAHRDFLSLVAGRHVGHAEGLSRAGRASRLCLLRRRQKSVCAQGPEGTLGPPGGDDGHAGGGVPRVLPRPQRQVAQAQRARLCWHRAGG